jgi:hypothetical protein
MKPETPNPRIKRPTTRGEAIRLVEQIYRENDWDANEQKRHQRIVGLDDKPLGERENSEIQAILNRFEVSRMVLFTTKKGGKISD